MGVIEQKIWPVETGILDLSDEGGRNTVASLDDIVEVWREARKKLENTDQLKEFNQRLAREWAIETGVIEDVFHIDKGVTVNLIEQGISAALLEHGSVDRPVEYVISILRDHIEALDWIFDHFIVQQHPLSVGLIKELHALMTAHQTHVDARNALGQPVRVELLRGDWKKLPNNAERDNILYCYCPPEQVASEMERLVSIHLKHQDIKLPPELQAAWLHHRFTQIHPFQDGNGRVARALATLVFLRAELFPLVISRDFRGRYIETLELADGGNLAPLIEIMVVAQKKRFGRALNISEDLVRGPATVELAIQGLKDKFNPNRERDQEKKRQVFDHAGGLEKIAEREFEKIIKLLAPIQASCVHSNESNSHYYRGQIIEEARALGYYANFNFYCSWVRLLIQGETPGNLVLSFHSRGTDFAGVMVCAPIFEILHPSAENSSLERTLLPIHDQAFEFYYTEAREKLIARFRPWLVEVLTLAIDQYRRFV